MDSCQQLFHICNKLLARAVIACLPSSNLQSMQQIAVTIRNRSQAMHRPQISITGKRGSQPPSHVSHAYTQLCKPFCALVQCLILAQPYQMTLRYICCKLNTPHSGPLPVPHDTGHSRDIALHARSGLQVLKCIFNGSFSKGADSLALQEVVVRSTGTAQSAKQC